ARSAAQRLEARRANVDLVEQEVGRERGRADRVEQPVDPPVGKRRARPVRRRTTDRPRERVDHGHALAFAGRPPGRAVRRLERKAVEQHRPARRHTLSGPRGGQSDVLYSLFSIDAAQPASSGPFAAYVSPVLTLWQSEGSPVVGVGPRAGSLVMLDSVPSTPMLWYQQLSLLLGCWSHQKSSPF